MSDANAEPASSQPASPSAAAEAPAVADESATGGGGRYAPPGWALAAGAPLILDASFVLALLEGDTGAARFSGHLSGSVLLSVNFGEVLYKAAQRAGRPVSGQIEQWLLASGVRLGELSVAAARHFPQLHLMDLQARAATRAANQAASQSAAPGARARWSGLSAADKSVLGHAMATGMPVLTGDKDWAKLCRYGLNVTVITY